MEDLNMCILTYDVIYDLSYNKTIFVIRFIIEKLGSRVEGTTPMLNYVNYW